MARFGNDQTNVGRLDIRSEDEDGWIKAHFIPSELPQQKLTARKRLAGGVELLEFNSKTGILKIHPINTLSTHSDYLGPKYNQIRTLILETQLLDDYCDDLDLELILEMLPKGFVKDYAYGLGLLKDCNRLIRLIEDNTSCDEIVFTNGDNVAINNTTFHLGLARFAEIWREIRRINDRGNRAASRVKDVFVHNNLAAPLGLTATEFSLGRHPTSRLIAKAADGTEELSSSERDELIGTITSESTAIAESAPQKFQQLRRDIELVSLDRLIESYADALEQNRPEQYWQSFFDDNTFALQQVFGAPMVSVRSGAAVGGRGFSGSGEKIADYLVKNSLTNNVALVEIKKPTTQLLSNQEYRQGVFAPSKELNGAITQVLDQAYNLTKTFTNLKENSRQWDLESYAVSCFVVAGRTPSANDPEKQKSFELYRANSRSVTIVTYDEILERLKMLRDFLAAPATPQEEG
ncbi:Shedu immune nuclease family protein [Actinomycetaceae bacterium MB13-C1-2]|nr:Shedu immune nuclease family protein [Actinomycetaceae bacterium MB13-C1-2]